MEQQTATDWLFEKLWETPKDKLDWYAYLKQAKQMEKEQIIDAFNNGVIAYDNQDRFSDDINDDAEQYYNETYNK